MAGDERPGGDDTFAGALAGGFVVAVTPGDAAVYDGDVALMAGRGRRPGESV